MANFTDLMKKLSDNIFTADKTKLALQQFATEEKLAQTASITDICKSLRDNENKSLFQFLLAAKHIALLNTVLTLLDTQRMGEWQDLIIEALFDAIKQSNVEAYISLKNSLPQEIIVKIQRDVRQLALRYSNYRTIMLVIDKSEDYRTAESLLWLAQNPHDHAYLVQQFSQNVIISARDNNDDNILHLALLNSHMNIFRFVVNHYGSDLLYIKNKNGMTPIDLVYLDIKTTAEQKKIEPNFSRLLMLDQVGAHLETEQYKDLYDSYCLRHKYHQPFLLPKQPMPQKEVHAVSFNGGGAKGQAFMAAFQEAIQHGILQQNKVKQFGGTSAGAITAGIFAMGFDITRCIEELNKFDFKQLMSETTTNAIGHAKATYGSQWMEYYLQGYYSSLVYSILVAVATEKLALWGSQPLITAVQELLTNTSGLFRPTYLRNTLLGLIKEKIHSTTLASIDPAHITFKDFKDHPAIFRELVVYVSNLTTGNPEKWCAEETPNIAIVDGIVTSASFPIFFEAPQKFEIITNAQGERERAPVLFDGKPVYCCDGGVLKNDPVDAFDHGHFNTNTLTFMLVSPDAKKLFEEEKQDFVYNKSANAIHVVAQLFKMMRNVERKHIHDDIRNQSRIIYIDTQQVGTLDFNNKLKNTPILETAAHEGVISYLNRRTANFYSNLRHDTIALLMSYGVANFDTNGLGQTVYITPGKRLTPAQILQIYAIAKKEEIIMLRSIVNPNQRNNNVSAMTLATHLGGFTETIKRLQLAGAVTLALEEKIDIQLLSFPNYLSRGEIFLNSYNHDKSLEQLHHLLTEKIHKENHLISKETALQDAAKQIQRLQSELKTAEDEDKKKRQQITDLKKIIQDKDGENKILVSTITDMNSKLENITEEADKKLQQQAVEYHALALAIPEKNIQHAMAMKKLALELKVTQDALAKSNAQHAELQKQISAKPNSQPLINSNSGWNTSSAFFNNKAASETEKKQPANNNPAEKQGNSFSFLRRQGSTAK